MMTKDEMRLAICEKLPELISCYFKSDNDNYTPEYWHIHWKKEYRPINWPTEGLQVCHEATVLIGGGATIVCTGTQWMVRIGANQPVFNKDLLTAWLEALCRVWWPERFV